MTTLRRLHCTAIVLGLAGDLASGVAAADVVAVVSATSPVTGLDAYEVADLFLGKASRFPGGAVAVPIDQVEGSAARREFYDTFTGKSAAQLRAYWSKIIFTGRGQPPRAVANGVDAKQLVAADPNAIAYVDRSEVDDTVKALLPR